ncbi:MAG: 50S ribosomal protein L18 [Hyphomicrobiales bacterium]|jgi:large subunit ribosomal protein L18|nr:50S ribosomal protein L18 [Hyphomicrobiales bacterium]|tara:strand:- start:12 stop:356 length:345 start_codon:yes stop_codon:yes gene_type:complete
MNSKIKRKLRVRRSLKKNNNQRPRLSVFRSSKNIYAQIIDDMNGKTLASASTLEKENRSQNGSDKKAAEKIGKLIAERSLKAGVDKVVFDRSGYLYHGRVKALADTARTNGLEF